MTRQVSILCLMGLLIAGTSLTQAQSKNIIISYDLAASSEALKVKMGAKWLGRIYNFKFGDYAVEESKMGWITTTQQSNIINTKTESQTGNKYSFILSNNTADSAIVNAVSNVEVKELMSFELFPNFYIGEDELSKFSSLFLSFITRTDNKDETWVLQMAESYGSDVEYTFEAFLRNGEQIIQIIPASSTKNGDEPKMLPAMGYEFVENGQSIGAAQYLGAGSFGFNKNIVWLKSELDPGMKLILAAAMTSLLQLKNP